MNSKNVLKIIGAVALINILGRLVGFLREAVIGYQYGTSFYADSIVTAYFFPNFFYMVIGGAITTAFISVYSKIDDADKKSQTIQSTFGFLSVFLIIFLGVISVFSESIISLLFAGMSKEELGLTNKLFLLMLPSAFFLILSMFFSGLLNVFQSFRAPAYATLVNNLLFVFIALVFTGIFGVYSYAIGAVGAAIGMILILWIVLKKNRIITFNFKFIFNKEMKSILSLSWPIILGGATVQLYFLIHRVFASYLGDGYIAALNYSAKLTQLPQVILITAVTTVIYPLLAKRVAQKHFDEIQRLYVRGIWMLFLFIVPISLFIAIFSFDIITFVFEYGNFTSSSTKLTAPLLTGLVLGMFAHSANVYITRFFYAYERSLTPVIISLICVLLINIILSFLLMNLYGALGIALGTTLSALVNFIFLIIFAKFMLKLNLFERNYMISILKWIVLFIFWTPTVYFLNQWLHFTIAILNLGIAFVISLAVFIILLKLLTLPEFEMLTKQIKQRIVVK